MFNRSAHEVWGFTVPKPVSCLLLIGLDLIQAGMKDVSGILHPDMLPLVSVLGLVALAALGAGLTVVMQSSSAAMTLALVTIQSGAISLTQRIVIVAGMNIGTTCTALLAALRHLERLEHYRAATKAVLPSVPKLP